jgi:hypothetical protein
MKQGDIIEIMWRDITCDTGWTSKRDCTTWDDLSCRTVGIFINEDELMISVCLSESEGEYHSKKSIPKSVIDKGYPKVINGRKR